MTLKDFIGVKAKLDDFACYVWGIQEDGGMQMLAQICDVRGWGAIQNLFRKKNQTLDFESAHDFHDALGQFIVDAINEKLEREQVRHD